jgi:hypothetical protein
MILIALIFGRIISQFMGKQFVRRCKDNKTRVSEMIAASVPIPMSPAIIIGLERGGADGNIIAL